MNINKRLDRTILSVAIVGILLLVNVVGTNVFGRLDLTRGKQFTLSSATHKTLHALTEPLTVRAYFTADLPAPYATQARYVKDLLNEYYTHGNGNVRFEFIDPASEETSDDKAKKKEVKQDIFGRAMREQTSIERELETLGIPPVQVRVNQDDKLEVKRAYMGLAILYGDKKEVIPVVSETQGLEYDLTTAIRKVSQAQQTHVAVLGGHQGLDSRTDLGRAMGVLGQIYKVSTVDLSQNADALSDVDALLVFNPKTAFSDAEKRQIDSYLVNGGSAAFLLGPVKVDMQALAFEDNDADLSDMLGQYGVRIEPGMVLDRECATITVSQQRGYMRVQQPVQYPFMPLPKTLTGTHPVVQGLSQVIFPFMRPLQLDIPQGSAVKGEVLVASSADSWVQTPPYNADPLQQWSLGAPQGKQSLVVSVVGPLKSAYDSAAAAPAGDVPAARLIVAGSAYPFVDQFLAKSNEALLLNLVDWLVHDDALLAVRSRGLATAQLHEVGDTQRATLKYLNVVGLPGAFVAFGLVRWRRRESRRSKVSF